MGGNLGEQQEEEVPIIQFIHYVPYILLSALLLPTFYYDMKEQRIPNKITVPAACVGVVAHIGLEQGSGLAASLGGLCLGGLILTGLHLLRAVGAGDIKLFAAIGAIMGVQFTLYCLMYSIIYAGMIGICMFLWRREFIQRIRNVGRYVFVMLCLHRLRLHSPDFITFPFMAAVLPAALTTSIYMIQ